MAPFGKVSLFEARRRALHGSGTARERIFGLRRALGGTFGAQTPGEIAEGNLLRRGSRRRSHPIPPKQRGETSGRDFSKAAKSASRSGDALAATCRAVTSYSLSTVNTFVGIRTDSLLSVLSTL